MSNNTSKAFSIRKQHLWSSNTKIFPDIIYLDANPIIDVVHQRGYGDLIEAYWQELTNHNGMLTWSTQTEEEVLRVLHRSEYQKHAHKNNIQAEYQSNGNVKKLPWKVVEDELSKKEAAMISKEVLDQKNSIFDIVGQYGIKIEGVDYEDVLRLTEYLYTNFGGSYDDAKHVSYANLGGTNNILSHDFGILNYPQQNLFGASRLIVKQSTNNQKPVKYSDLTETINDDIAKGS